MMPTLSITNQGGAELPVGDEADVDDRLLAGDFPGNEQQEGEAGDGGGANDECRVEPIVLLPFVEHDLEEAEAKRDEHETDPVDLEPAPQMLGAFPAQGFRLVDEQVDERERKEAHRHVDEEDPVPGDIVGDVAADRRSERRRHDHRHAVKGEGLRAFRGREGVGEHRLLARREAAAAEPLQHAWR